MALSRNPVEFLRRNGLVDEPPRPNPRLDLRALRVHTYPLSAPPKPAAAVLVEYEGHPPPDRGGARPWPNQLEET